MLSPQTSYLPTMRLALALTLLASPAAAWEFSPAPICTLTNTSDAGEITVTYDASLPEYTITLTLADGQWSDAPAFGMAFDGGRSVAIQTDRHTLSPDGRSLTVKDRGFGNVLNGLEFNTMAMGASGDTFLAMPLAGIGPAIQAFRDCPADQLS
ncbi:excinuclease ABC subunit B [Yoonia sp. SDW83-1]|uniref:excinuclease ABC subunit B n=1 Tax=Yoonia sp. SDW83-1 TaxID=3366945 RepID=UPI00398C601C